MKWEELDKREIATLFFFTGLLIGIIATTEVYFTGMYFL